MKEKNSWKKATKMLNIAKNVSDTQYFDHIHISPFMCTQIANFIFWSLCMAKIVFYQLGLSIFEKRLL